MSPAKTLGGFGCAGSSRAWQTGRASSCHPRRPSTQDTSHTQQARSAEPLNPPPLVFFLPQTAPQPFPACSACTHTPDSRFEGPESGGGGLRGARTDSTARVICSLSPPRWLIYFRGREGRGGAGRAPGGGPAARGGGGAGASGGGPGRRGPERGGSREDGRRGRGGGAAARGRAEEGRGAGLRGEGSRGWGWGSCWGGAGPPLVRPPPLPCSAPGRGGCNGRSSCSRSSGGSSSKSSSSSRMVSAAAPQPRPVALGPRPGPGAGRPPRPRTLS